MRDRILITLMTQDSIEILNKKALFVKKFSMVFNYNF